MRLAAPLFLLVLPACAAPVPREHPRLLGSRAELQALAAARPRAWERCRNVARGEAGDWELTISQALVRAIEGDRELGRQAVERALRYVRGPIRVGHETFGHDLALVGVAYDLCYDDWTAAERTEAIDYINRTCDANVDSETHVFHNGWYGYKQWGIGVANYAVYHDSPRAAEHLARLYDDWTARAAPALELAGAGGGWAEGYYIHYWLYEWLFFCEVARHCEGRDLYADAPSFFTQRAVASMFEMYPGIREYGSRRPIPTGDGGGQLFGGDRDKALFARCILVNRYRDDPAHQAVHAFGQQTPRSSVGNYAYKDFLWRDETVAAGDLAGFRLSHHSPGPGYVYARSSWADDATHFFFKCGDRFTAHQHLDVGQFMIAKHEPLTGDGGHYADFADRHAVNYYVRSIAHSVPLILDPAETWPNIRGAATPGNDGGQHHDWPHHNGAVVDPAAWQAGRERYDLGDILEFRDEGAYLYLAADATRAYRAAKLAGFTRRIVYLRPDTFILVDRVESTDAVFAKTWQLQTMTPPVERAPWQVVTNGAGRLFVQPLLPADARVNTVSGDALYDYDGQSFAPARTVGPAPEGRVELRPAEPATVDWFVVVLTAAEATTEAVPVATVEESDEAIVVTVGAAVARFARDGLECEVTAGG